MATCPLVRQPTTPRRLLQTSCVALMLLAGAFGATHADTVVACSGAALIQAIDDANAAGGDTLELAPGCTYTFTRANNFWYGPNALPAIHSNIDIRGHGATLKARHTGDPTPATSNAFRFFYVSGGFELPAGSLSLEHLTLTGGYAKGGNSKRGGGGAGMGGAIFNQGTLDLHAVTLSHNTAQGGNTGSSVAEVDITGGGGMGQNANGVRGGGFGGALKGGPFGGNGVGASSATSGGGSGGGGFLAARDGAPGVDVQGGAGGGLANLGGAGGGGYGGDGGAGGGGGTGTRLSESGADGGNFGGGGGYTAFEGGGGGGIGGGGSAGGFMLGPTMSMDFVTAGGGGGFGGGGGAGHFDSTRSTGTAGSVGGFGGFGGGGGATTGAGLIYGGGGGFAGGYGGGSDSNWYKRDGGAGGGIGGAIFNHTGSVTVVNSTLSGNRARGGISDLATDGSGVGGAIFNLNGTVWVAFCSVAGNSVAGSNGASKPAAGPGNGAALYSLAYGNNIIDGSASTASLTIEDSIISDNHGATAAVVNNRVDGDHRNTANLTWLDANLAPGALNLGAAAGNLPANADPGLGPLADHGGATWTMLPAAGGPAIDAVIDCGAAGHIDQRGMRRPQGTGCDLGAVELMASSATLLQDIAGDAQHSLTGKPFAASLVVQALDANGAPVSGAMVIAQVPTSGAKASCTPDAYTNANGYASIACVANGVPGTYQVTLSIGAQGGYKLSTDFTLTNDRGDYIFADGFDTTAASYHP